MTQEIGVEHADVVVLMIRIWSHCQQRRSDTFPGLSNKALATLCRFGGDPDSLFRSLEAHGFLSREPGGELRILKRRKEAE